MPKAKEIGKFIYIEPNNLNTDKPSNAIPQPYEDYSMAVDLQVEIPSRDSCGDPNFKKILYFSSDNGTISFFGGSGGGDGKQGYLTTNYTDVSASNVGRGNKECLGISSINITYDSWFFPTVTINFVDVRGASLMMPQEYAYRTELSNGTKEITQLSGGSFFKALFSFPYPVFKLTVKGFYGMAATYNLAVKDFKASFNSNTGNFECVAQFIGYMFGVYTDIPMTYLAVAPYIGRTIGSKYGSSWSSSKHFMYHIETKDGEELPTRRMMTFPEFKLAVASASTQLDKIVASTETALNMNEIAKKKTALNQIKIAFNNLGFSKSGDKNGCFYYMLSSKDTTELAKQVIDLQGRVEAYCDANYSENDSGSLKRTLAPLFSLIGNKKSEKYLCPWLYNEAVKDGSGIEFYHMKASAEDVKKAENAVGEKGKYIFETIRTGEYTNKLKSYLGNNKGGVYTIAFYLCTDFSEYLDGQDKEYERKNRDFEIKLKEERLNALSQILGFNPSIKNIFDMTFAHMETFVKEYYSMLNDIRTDMEAKKRNPGTFGFSSNEQTDFRIVGPDNPTNSTKQSDKQVPPFPLFVKEVIEEDGTKVNRTVGPWEFDDENMKMPEMQFVIKLLNAAKFYSEEAKKVNEAIEQVQGAQGSTSPNIDKLVPLTLYDFFNLDFNPYQCVQKSGREDTDRTNQIILTFFLRWYYYAKTFQFNSNAEMKYFAQMEASNLKKAVPKITENIRNTLFHWDIIETMKKGQNLWEINGKKTLYKKESKNNIIFDWLTNDDGSIQYLPIGEFDVNAIKKDLETSAVTNSKKYAMIKDGAFYPHNNQNFKIEDNGYYFDELITEIKNADDGNGNVKEKILRDLNEGSVFTSSSHKVEPYIKDGEIFKTDEKTYTVSQVLNNDVPTDKINNLRVIGFDGTAIDADFQKSVFDNEIFKSNEGNILGQAYLFLMSLPIRTTIFEDGSYIINNGTTLRSLLLREGAYWWRYDSMDDNNGGVDPIKLIVNEKELYENAARDEIYITKEDNTLSFVKKGSNIKYLPFNKGDFAITDGRKNALKLYFKDWVNKEFAKILFQVNNKKPKESKVDGVNTKVGGYADSEEYIKLMLETLTDVETVVDETPLKLQKGKASRLANVSEDNFKATFKKFVDALKDKYPKENDVAMLTTEANYADGTDIINDKDLMLSTYLILKSLYDKWFCGADQKKWYLDEEGSDFKNFKYIDSYYNNIGYRLIPSIESTLALIDKFMPDGSIKEAQTQTQYNILSVHQFLSENCEKMGVYFKSLPLMYGLDPNDKGKIEKMFDAIPFSKYTSGNGMSDGQTYICMYTYKPSEHLDIRDDAGQYDYTDDSFDIADINGEQSNILPAALSEVGKNMIPSFGVTYAVQNQSYFKSINVSMNNPMQTEASIATTMMLASKSGDGPREMTMYGQDLYRIYSNYSYTCDVEMIGNSQIVPMMYFQLNNIPMFRGAYMITKVEHNIRAGDMTTKFTGVRQNKNATPLVNGSAILLDPNGAALLLDYEGSQNGYLRTEGNYIYPYVNSFTELSEEAIAEKFSRNGGRFSCDDAIMSMYESMKTTLEAGHNKDGEVAWAAMTKKGGYGNCAGFVRRYIQAGGVSTEGAPDSAVDYIDWLPNIKFFKIDTILAKDITSSDCKVYKGQILEKSKKICQRGDIAVMAHGKYGHICMWNDLANNGNGAWVSDFEQYSAWPYCEKGKKPNDIFIFRFGGEDIGRAKRIITPDLKAPF